MSFESDMHEAMGADPQSAAAKTAKAQFGINGLSSFIERGLSYDRNRNATYESQRIADQNKVYVEESTKRGSYEYDDGMDF